MMRKTQFGNPAFRVVKATVDVERDRGTLRNKGVAHAVATAVHEFLNPFLEPTHNFLKIVCDGLLGHSLWK